MGWQPETQPKGKLPVEKTKGAETMQRPIEAQDAFNVLTDYYHHSTHVQHLALQEALNKVPTVDAVPLDGSFLKMSKGDYLIYNRHWLYEHFDMEMEIQRSAMKSMGYEPAIKDAEPQWIPCSERLPEKNGYYLTTTCYREVYCDFWNEDHFDRTEAVIAWMPLPEPYEVKE